MNTALGQTHYVATFHHIDDDRCIQPLVEALHDDPSWLRTPGDTDGDREAVACLTSELEAMFRAAGWEGDGTIGCIFLAPCFVQDGHGNCQVIYHVKQSNNGTSFLAIPNRLALAKHIGDVVAGDEHKRQEPVESLVRAPSFPHLQEPGGRWLQRGAAPAAEPGFSFRRACHYASKLRELGMADIDIQCLLSDLYWDAVTEMDLNRPACPKHVAPDPERLKLAVQLAAGLLASGHYTEVSSDCGHDDDPDPRVRRFDIGADWETDGARKRFIVHAVDDAVSLLKELEAELGQA